MIFGRPANLWTGLITLISGAIASTALALGADPATVAALIGPWTAVLGGVVLLIANQPPTVSEGDQIKVVTPSGQPNYTIEATPTPPPAVVQEG